MTLWIIEPRDPLIVRDGRPFSAAIAGARATSLDFPFPSTTTGGVRTRYGLSHERDFDDGGQKADLIAEVRELTVRGPLLVELDDHTDHVVRWFAHAPADALLLDLDPPAAGRVVLRRLLPRSLPAGSATNLPAGLLPVFAHPGYKGKPCGNAPRYWRWESFEKWLVNPSQLTKAAYATADLGHNGPAHEARTHVGVQPGTWTVAEGALFQTRGLEFSRHEKGDPWLTTKRLALAVLTDATGVTPGLAPLGGERRIVNWREGAGNAAQLPECPKGLRDDISQTGACRLVLLTPAHFTAGFYPQEQTLSWAGVTPHLRAVANGRAQVVSGWDFDIKKPKLTRRLTPAGTVFFLELDGDEATRRDWIDRAWMQCISDDQQDRRDGFGLAVLGSWRRA